MIRGLRLHWPVFAAVAVWLIVGVAELLSPAGSTIGRIASVLWATAPVAIAICQYAMHSSQDVRLAINRIRFRMLNPESTWAVDVEYWFADATAAYESFVGLMKEQPARSLAGEASVGVWSVGSIVVRASIPQIADPLDAETDVLRIEVPEIKRSYRGWRSTIQDECDALLAEVERRLRPERGRYVARITFTGTNPYFGLLMNDVSQPDVVRFDVEFFEQVTGNRELVQLRPDRVQIVAGSLRNMERLSLRYLALAPTYPGRD